MVSYQNLLASYAQLVALRLTDFFLSVCLCEEAFSQVIIKSRYLNRFTEECLKCCIHLCLSNYKPFSNKVSQVCSVVHQLRNRKVNEKHILIIVNSSSLKRLIFNK